MIDNIGVLGAMPEEVALLTQRLEGPQAKTLAGVEFHTGRMAGRQVTVCLRGHGQGERGGGGTAADHGVRGQGAALFRHCGQYDDPRGGGRYGHQRRGLLP